jgi:hypothetical protein
VEQGLVGLACGTFKHAAEDRGLVLMPLGSFRFSRPFIPVSIVERRSATSGDRFREAREDADPDRRFLSGYFKTLMYGDI